MTKNTRCTQPRLRRKRQKKVSLIYDPVYLDKRITTIKDTLKALEDSPPPLGGKWRSGMIRYYSKVLSELESYRGNAGKADSSAG